MKLDRFERQCATMLKQIEQDSEAGVEYYSAQSHVIAGETTNANKNESEPSSLE